MGDLGFVPRMRYSAKPGNPSKSSIRQIKLYSVAVKTAVTDNIGFISSPQSFRRVATTWGSHPMSDSRATFSKITSVSEDGLKGESCHVKHSAIPPSPRANAPLR